MFVKIEAEILEILCGEFDMVVSNNVVEHLEDPHRIDLVTP